MARGGKLPSLKKGQVKRNKFIERPDMINFTRNLILNKPYQKNTQKNMIKRSYNTSIKMKRM
jgi:hypothetical protein